MARWWRANWSNSNAAAIVPEFVFRKFDDSPHWVHDEILLGEDECGTWIGQHAGMLSARPGASFRTESPNVTVLPPGEGWVATIFDDAQPAGTEIYVDIVDELDVAGLTAIDMDLDVVLQRGRLWIDDEDEFDQHRVELGYPDEVVARCRADADRVLAMIRDGQPPFDGRAARWLEVLAAGGATSRGL